MGARRRNGRLRSRVEVPPPALAQALNTKDKDQRVIKLNSTKELVAEFVIPPKISLAVEVALKPPEGA